MRLETGWLHEARVRGLRPGEPWWYRVSGGATYQTRTASASGRIRFVVFGDSGAGGEEQRLLGERMAREEADFALHTGDLAYPVADYEGLLARHFGMYGRWLAETPLFPCPGNHDYADAEARPYRALHRPPVPAGVAAEDAGLYYRWDFGPVRILSIDSNRAACGAESAQRMLRWLDAELALAPAFWTVALFHHPPRTAGFHREHPLCVWTAEHLAPRLRKAGIPLVVSGHDHNYQRFAIEGGTHYLVTGGGGGALYQVGHDERLEASAARHHYLRCEADGYRLLVEAVGLDGEAFDACALTPRPWAAPGGLVSAADFASAPAAGGVAALFGRFLAAPGGADWPRVRVGGQEALALGAEAGQLNLLIPEQAVGETELEVESPNGRSRLTVTVAAAAPSVFVRDGAPVGLSGAVRPGQTTTIYATGLGVGLPLGVEVGGVATVAQARKDTGVAGVAEVSFTVPASLRAGTHPLRLSAGGYRGNPAPLLVG
jgi:uncharacterized protein (TIGR03437 family)